MAYTLRTNQTWPQVEAEIRDQLRKWGASTYSLTRPNYSSKTARGWSESPAEATVVLKANWKSGRELNLSYNKQSRSVDNARVLFLVIEAMRLNEVRGIQDVMREAYAQLPAPATPKPPRDPYELLGVREDAPMTLIEKAYQMAAQEAHPDKGGSNEAMAELNAALERIKADRGAR